MTGRPMRSPHPVLLSQNSTRLPAVHAYPRRYRLMQCFKLEVKMQREMQLHLRIDMHLQVHLCVR